MSPLAKDNSGFDLPGLFTGSEGTLALITSTRVRLVPLYPYTATALVGVSSLAAAVELFLRRIRSAGGQQVDLAEHAHEVRRLLSATGGLPLLIELVSEWSFGRIPRPELTIPLAGIGTPSSSGCGLMLLPVSPNLPADVPLWMMPSVHVSVYSMGSVHGP